MLDWTKTYPKPHPQTAGRVIDGEAVLILADASEINVLNRVGSSIYELADGTHSVAEIAWEISQLYDTSYAEAETDTVDFLAGLVAQDVMVFEQKKG